MSSSPNARQPAIPNVWPGHHIVPERLALSQAASSGDVEGVQRLLLDLPLSFELPQPRATYLSNARLAAARRDLQDASRSGDVERVRMILERWRTEPSIRDPTPEDLSLPMIEAARGGHVSVVSKLLDEGALVDHTVPTVALKTGNEAVSMLAVKNEGLMRFLLDQGADPNLTSSRGMKTLECAASSGTVSVVSLLLERGARLEECNSLHHAVCTRNTDDSCFEMMEFLLQKGVDINERSWITKQKVRCRTTADTALMSAVKKHEKKTMELDLVERAKWLLNHGADPDIADDAGKKPIDYAVDQRLIDVLNSLQSGSNFD
ncbi:hypothetical protein G7Y89_g14078 [Cudoniella acicularis]|uniref:Uncharacterized protein n=1 Tax=Cudoniella acicularis TaxID=354080 RepID=A0A8H4R615_9HELO|nr:hypothetical protein G7Y89_g14078 [Cudoniella acicularis]